MARTQRLTIRLLKQDVRDPEDALTIKLNQIPLNRDLDFTGAVFYKPSHANPPKWLKRVESSIQSRRCFRTALARAAISSVVQESGGRWLSIDF